MLAWNQNMYWTIKKNGIHMDVHLVTEPPPTLKTSHMNSFFPGLALYGNIQVDTAYS